jgi:RNA polymerase sigma-70 factor (ECF subfamily)
VDFFCDKIQKAPVADTATNDMTVKTMETDQAWDAFLKSVERRAFQMARIATSHNEEALDIVQDAMFKLVKKYRGKPIDELTPLFYRILQSKIRDWYRRQRVRQRWQFWVNSEAIDEDPGSDPISNAPAPETESPEKLMLRNQSMQVLEDALSKLPLRQQQTFLLRAWEGLSVSEASLAMGCSEGSIKTHYYRAIHTLREKLEGHWP